MHKLIKNNDQNLHQGGLRTNQHAAVQKKRPKCQREYRCPKCGKNDMFTDGEYYVL